MNGWWRRILGAFGFVGLLLVAYTLAYRWGLATFEGHRITLAQSLQTVVEALTTAGFGGEAEFWNSAPINLMVVVMNVTGVALVFFAIPLFVVPLFREAVAERPPETTDLTDHVVVCGNSTRSEVLRRELEAVGRPSLFVDPDPETAVELDRAGVDAIHGDPEAAETLELANLPEARALVVDLDDETNANVILAAGRVAPEVEVVSVVEDADAETYHRYAGADHAIRPRVMVGEGLARKASHSLSTAIRDEIRIGDDFELAEVLVDEGSELAGETLASSGIRAELGINVVGAWVHGEFVAPVPPDTQITEHTVLLVAGDHEDLVTLRSRVETTTSDLDDGVGSIVVCGYGVVGQTIEDALADEEIEVTVVDLEEMEGVDVVGDVTDPETVREAGIPEADSAVLALNDDSLAVFAALVLEEHAPGVEILARVNDVDNVQKLYDAGVEYALVLSRVTGHAAASRVIDEEEAISFGSRVEVIRTEAPALVGHSMGDADLRARTGATVVALERDGDVLTSVGPDLVVESGDTLIVAGDAGAITEFLSLAV